MAVRDVEVDLGGLRTAGGAMLAAGMVWPLLPHGVALACPFRRITGIPCPLCGMTRSVVATLHLEPHRALVMNPAGIVAVLVAVVLLVNRTRPTIRVPRWSVPVGLLALWSCQLLRLLFT